MIRVAVCDDSKTSLEMIEEVLNDISEIELSWDCFQSGNELIKYVDESKTEEQTFDLFLLDIEMPDMNGIETAKQIIEDMPQASIAFLTSHKEYMNPALEIYFCTFLTKPLSKEIMISLLQRLDGYLENAKKRVTVKSGRDIHNLCMEDIVFIERKCKYTYIHTVNRNEPIKVVTKLLQLPNDVLNKMFINTHSSFLVNKSFIKTIEKETVVLNKGGTVPISRKYNNYVKKEYLSFSKEGM